MSAGRTTIYTTTKGLKANYSVDLMKVGGLGPIIAIAMQDGSEPDKLGRANAVLAAWKIDPETGIAGRALASTTTSAVTDEDTGYVGNAADLNFTGQALNNLPIVPRSVILHTDAVGNAELCFDKGDGHFYTSDTDEDECGTIDYFTGAITLYFPAGKAPAVGAIDAAYLYESAVLRPYGRRTYIWPTLTPQDILVVAGACAATDVDSKACASTLVHCDIIVSGDAQSLGGL